MASVKNFQLVEADGKDEKEDVILQFGKVSLDVSQLKDKSFDLCDPTCSLSDCPVKNSHASYPSDLHEFKVMVLFAIWQFQF